ncbi:MAG: hypothetical protein ACTHJU_06130 [Sphingopyxis sp.]
MIVKAAAILFLIALSGCAEEVPAHDPPDIGLASEPGAGVFAETPAETVVANPPAPESPSEDESEPPMRSPVQLD